jgi:hypothetical protein
MEPSKHKQYYTAEITLNKNKGINIDKLMLFYCI